MTWKSTVTTEPSISVPANRVEFSASRAIEAPSGCRVGSRPSTSIHVAGPNVLMRKARSSKEKTAEGEALPEGGVESAPRRSKGGRRRRDAPETNGVEADAAEAPLRPVLTAISRPVRDDELHEVPEDPSAPPVIADVPVSPEPAASTVISADGTPMQVLKLNDLKRMRITELSHMAQDFGVEGTQGLKKQDLIFSLLSGIADKKFEVHAEGVLEVQSDGFGFLRSSDFDYQPSPDDIYVRPSQVRRFNLRTGDTVYRADPPAARGRAVLRAAEGRQDQLRRPGQQRDPGADPLRQPHPALPDPEAEPRVRRRRR